jgi:hypothetical protein
MNIKSRLINLSCLLILCFYSSIFSCFSSVFQKGVATRLSPSPIKVNGLEESKINLGGTWKFNPSPKSGFQFARKVPLEWSNIAVPGEWTMQGFKVKPKTSAAYFKSFAVPVEWSNCIIKLRCDAIYSDAQIWINGKEVGMHQGGMNAFEMDVTSIIKSGNDNIIAMAVMNESLSDSLMTGTQYAAHQLGGILRKVYLIALPKVNLSFLGINTNWENGSNIAQLTVDYEIENQSGEPITGSNIQFDLFNPSGEKVEMDEVLDRLEDTILVRKRVFNIKDPKKWDAEHPNLYTLRIILNANNQSEQINQRFGFRKIEVVGNQVFLNEKPIKLRGVNRHDVHPLLGRALNQELWEKDIRLFRAANVNYIRTSHYPPAEEFVDLCDELGIYVEVENPISWVGQEPNSKWYSEDSSSERYLTLIKQITNQTVEYLKNHPSVIFWSMANESVWGSRWKENLHYIQSLDKTRPITFHDNAYGSFNNFGSTDMPIANIHYPGPAGPEIARDFPRPLLFGEYVHLNTYNRQEIVTDPGVRDAWGRGLESMWNNMYYSRGSLGGAIWAGVDDVFMLGEGKAVGYGEWGIIDGWRREKPEYYHVKKTYSPVKVYTNEIRLPIIGNEIILQAENRFDFTNFNELKIEWTLGSESGTVSPNILPHTYGAITISPNHQVNAGEFLVMKFTSPLGYLIDEYQISVGECLRQNISQNQEVEPLALTQVDSEIMVKGKTFLWIFDASNGTIKKAYKNGQQILSGGPSLMILPLTTGPCQTEYSLSIEPLNNTCSNWKINELITEETINGIVVKVNGSYNEANGTFSYTIDHNGNLQIDYLFTSTIDVNPRQWGLVFAVPRNVENLKWDRKGLYTTYPDNHIGRLKGEAIPFPFEHISIVKFGIKPNWDWRFDSNELGSNDFRSSKDCIYEASLESKEGFGIRIDGKGTQTFRSFVHGESIQFLVTSFSTGGGDLFFSSHLEKSRKPIKIGDQIGGTINLQLFSN